MDDTFAKWLRKTYSKITGSIAFYPAIIATGFLLLSWLMLELDFSATGKNIKVGIGWIRLHDASTARSIVSTIVAGVISLTVFSFSMVMILLNQAASQMSNRMLENMIGNRFQQIVLGIYIGSIVYALFLLSSIRDVDSGIYVPALSIYLLLMLAVTDIFLFIYFLHYVTQSVKFETIIDRVHKKTMRGLTRHCTTDNPETFIVPETGMQTIRMESSNYFQTFNKKQLLRFAITHKGMIRFLHPEGTYLLKDTPLLIFYSPTPLSESEINKLLVSIDFFKGQPLEKNPFFGYHQLAEVAIKALSPGINDPGTAVLSIHALADLFHYRLHHFSRSVYVDENDVARIQIIQWSFEDLFSECYYPIWEYGKKDRYVQDAMQKMLEQLKLADSRECHLALFNVFQHKIQNQIDGNKL